MNMVMFCLLIYIYTFSTLFSVSVFTQMTTMATYYLSEKDKLDYVFYHTDCVFENEMQSLWNRVEGD